MYFQVTLYVNEFPLIQSFINTILKKRYLNTLDLLWKIWLNMSAFI